MKRRASLSSDGAVILIRDRFRQIAPIANDSNLRMRHLLERRQCPVLKSRKFIDSSTTPARVESAAVAKQKILLFVTGASADCSSAVTDDQTSAPASLRSSQLGLAITDLQAGLRRFELWGILGWHDIRQRYRRSVIGPFWLTISTAVMVGAMGFLYARIFKQDVSTYLPYLAVGLVVWGTISTMVNESCTVFTAAEQIIKQIRVPLTTHVCRLAWRNAIIFAHNAIILAVVMLWYGSVTFPNLVA